MILLNLVEQNCNISNNSFKKFINTTFFLNANFKNIK